MRFLEQGGAGGGDSRRSQHGGPELGELGKSTEQEASRVPLKRNCLAGCPNHLLS